MTARGAGGRLPPDRVPPDRVPPARMPPGSATNVAGDAATVGVQAQAVHGDVSVYQIRPDATPEESFEIGVKYLDGGMPSKARQLIDHARVHGYVTSSVCFHWLLAMLSGRTLQQISAEDMAKLKTAPKWFGSHDDDDWMGGIMMIGRLLESLNTPDADPRVVVKEFDELAKVQRDKILRHLELFLKGSLQDRIWARAFKQAKHEQVDHERRDRVWRFFHPEPARARVRVPRPVATTVGDWVRSIIGTMVFAIAAGFLVRLALHRGGLSTTFAVLVTLFAGYVSIRTGLEWRFRVQRVRALDAELLPPRRWAAAAPENGFSKRVDRLFNRYFARYVPDGVDRKDWLAETSGIRKTLRDEIVEVYRERRVGASGSPGSSGTWSAM